MVALTWKVVALAGLLLGTLVLLVLKGGVPGTSALPIASGLVGLLIPATKVQP